MDMSMGGMDMDMGSMSMGDGVPGLFYLQRMYWAVIGAAIGAATIANALNKLVAAQRFTDSSATPAKPKSIVFTTYATATAMMREILHSSIAPLSVGRLRIQLPPLGSLITILCNLVILLVLCFYKLDPGDQWSWENIGYRTGFVSVAQLPLIVLLSSKNNIVGLLTGTSYERLNWLHRWTSRTLWLTVTIHMCFWFRSWGRYDYIIVKITTDPLSQKGFAAWCILTFIVLASLAPIRKWSYELFVLSHIISFVGFFAVVWLHALDGVTSVYVSIALFAFDWVSRFALSLYSNLSIFHGIKRQSDDNTTRHLWANRASFTPLPGDVTRVTIKNPLISWKPGQHVFLSCHSILPLQSHPFTISSIPSDKKLEFIIRAERGGTRKFFRHANKHDIPLDMSPTSGAQSLKPVGIEGPYGRIRPLRQFDSVVLIAGGMGATYTMPLMRDIVEGWKAEYLEEEAGEKSLTGWFSSTPNSALTKRLQFVWVVRRKAQLSWFANQLQRVLRDFDKCCQSKAGFDKSIEVDIYVTGEDEILDSGLSRTQSVDEKVPYLQTTGPMLPTSPGTPTSDWFPSSNSYDGNGHLELSPGIRMLRGRPQPHDIIREVLERAEGESAVVACGPYGLKADVRRSVVALSDERAVHKGTGAQGVYLHVETFEF